MNGFTRELSGVIYVFSFVLHSSQQHINLWRKAHAKNAQVAASKSQE